MGHQDDRLVAVDPVEVVGIRCGPAGTDGQVRSDPADDVAEVGDPLSEIILLDPGEAGGVGLQNVLDRRKRRELLRLDPLADPGKHPFVVDDLEVGLEDLGLGRAELLANLEDDRLELGGRGGHGPLEPLDLGRYLRGVGEGLRIARPEDRVDPISHPHHHARTDRDSLMHRAMILAGNRPAIQTRSGPEQAGSVRQVMSDRSEQNPSTRPDPTRARRRNRTDPPSAPGSGGRGGRLRRGSWPWSASPRR